MTEEAHLNDFLRRYAEDLQQGTVRPRQEYLEMFADAAEAIDRELDRLEAGRAPDLRRIGGYEIVDVIGRGGQGIVYKARDVRLGRTVALKVLSDRGGWTEDSLQRFRREARIASKIDNAGVCTIYEAGDVDGTPFIAMRFLEGENLAERFGTQVGPPDRERVLANMRLIEQAARALHAAHEQGVIHRDIKPANLMIGSDGQVVVMDFGLARDDDADLITLTQSGDFFGTPPYMSPEQLTRQATGLDRRTDIWSLGATLYEGVSGQRPFRALTREGLFQAILTREPPDPRRLNRCIPPDLRVVLETALRKNRGRRYQSALDLAEELRRIREGEPILARPTSILGRALRWTRREPFKAAALIITVLATLALVGQARQSERAIGKERDLAIARKAEFDQLAGVVRLEDALAKERTLYPAWPESTDAMERWLDNDAARLVSLKPTLLKTIADLEQRGLHGIDRGQEDDEATQQARGIAEESQRFLLANLSRLADDIEAFEADEKKSVEQRLSWARRIDALTRDHPNSIFSWEEAREAIAAADGVLASELYAEQPIELEPQTGLVPLGMNPVTGLWEFYHLRTAYDPGSETDPAEIPIPEHRDDGTLPLEEESGLVFVLIPGGTFWMGAQAEDPSGRNYDPLAKKFETRDGKSFEVTLDPFFLSRYEMTQGQWQRTVGSNPSLCKPGYPLGDDRQITLLHPVEQVSWDDCVAVLGRLGLRLPSEAQWENGCRARTETPWWTGTDKVDLDQAGNIADRYGKANGGGESWPYELELNDGFTLHAPAGRFRANPFGLHDVIGNVWEWCLDDYADYRVPAREGDGGRYIPGAPTRVLRGGTFGHNATSARSAFRNLISPDYSYLNLGVRPARTLTD